MCCEYIFIMWFFFFKRKTAYDMRISDWSSDVCSSDLTPPCPPSQDRPSRWRPHRRDGGAAAAFRRKHGFAGLRHRAWRPPARRSEIFRDVRGQAQGGGGSRQGETQGAQGRAPGQRAEMNRLAIFDCDGTLVDSQVNICLAMEDCFARAGLETPRRERTRRVVGLSLVEAMRAMLPDADPEFHRALAERSEEHTSELQSLMRIS